MKIANKIKEIRNEKKLTQKELAAALNIGQSSICEWEQGKYEPTISALISLSKFFNCSIEYLVGIEDDFGIIQNKTNSLTSKEQRLLKSFAQLDNDEQNKIIEDVEYFANKHTSIKSKIRKTNENY